MDSKNENTENLSKKKVPNKDEEFNNFFFVGGDDWIKNEKESISKEKKNKIKLLDIKTFTPFITGRIWQKKTDI